MRSLKTAIGACLLAGTAALALTAPARGATAPSSGHFTGTLANATTWIADVPASWNGTLLLYSHGFGPLTAADAPDPVTQAALLARGYALAGSSYDPNGSQWALDTAVSDQFGTLAAVERTVLPARPRQVLAFGTSMGGLVSALEAQESAGRVDGALTTCGIVAGGINLNEYQLDGEYAMAQLLLPGRDIRLVNFGGPDGASQAVATATALAAAAAQAQQTAAGRGWPSPSPSSTPRRGTPARPARPRPATRRRRRPPSTTWSSPARSASSTSSSSGARPSTRRTAAAPTGTRA